MLVYLKLQLLVIIEEAQMYENGTLASIYIRFLADAHICAYEDPLAYGRYICFNQIISNAEDVVNLAQSL